MPVLEGPVIGDYIFIGMIRRAGTERESLSELTYLPYVLREVLGDCIIVSRERCIF